MIAFVSKSILSKASIFHNYFILIHFLTNFVLISFLKFTEKFASERSMKYIVYFFRLLVSKKINPIYRCFCYFINSDNELTFRYFSTIYFYLSSSTFCINYIFHHFFLFIHSYIAAILFIIKKENPLINKRI